MGGPAQRLYAGLQIAGVVCDIVIGEMGGLDSPRAWLLALVAKPVPVTGTPRLILTII